MTVPGRPASQLSDAELEEQGSYAHATRNWVFLHGTAEQFAHHTERMLELEQEYLGRHPQRTWQGAGGGGKELDEASRLRLALRGIQHQIDALLAARPADDTGPVGAPAGQVAQLLQRVAAAGGRLHKLELHQVARELGIRPAALASLYKGPQAVLRADRDERLLVDAPPDSLDLRWDKEVQPRWDTDKQELFATVPAGVFDLAAEPDAELLEEWWSLRDATGKVLGYGWMDSGWGGDVEILLAVHAGAREQGLGSQLLYRLEQEAAARGVNYVYNTVRETHPDRAALHDWLAARGYQGSDRDQGLRKRVRPTDPAPAPAVPHAARPVAPVAAVPTVPASRSAPPAPGSGSGSGSAPPAPAAPGPGSIPPAPAAPGPGSAPPASSVPGSGSTPPTPAAPGSAPPAPTPPGSGSAPPASSAPGTGSADPATAPSSGGSDRGPGQEEAGGYVDVDDHRY